MLHVEGEPGCSPNVFHFRKGNETTRANIMTETFSNLRLGIVFIAFFFFSFEIKYYLVAINKRYALFRGKLLCKFCACLRRRNHYFVLKVMLCPLGHPKSALGLSSSSCSQHKHCVLSLLSSSSRCWCEFRAFLQSLYSIVEENGRAESRQKSPSSLA